MNLNSFAEVLSKIPRFELRDVYIEDPHLGWGLTKQEKFQAVVEDGKSEAIAVVTTRYTLVQMRDLFADVLSQVLAEGPARAEVFYHWGRGQLRVFPEGSDVGIAVENSVDASRAIVVYFIKEVNGANRTTLYLRRTFWRAHVGEPLSHTVNFSKILAEAREAWRVIMEQLTKKPLTREIIEAVKENVEGEKLIEFVDEYANNHHLGNPSVWDFLSALLKFASAGHFKSAIHREQKLRRLSTLLLSLATESV